MAPRKAPAKRTAAAKPKPPARGRTRRLAKTAAPRRAPRTQAPAARARRPKAKAGTPSAKPRLLRVDVVEKNREAAPIAPSAVPASRARRPLPQRSAEGAGATSTFVQLFTRDPDSLLVFWQASAQAVATLLGEMGERTVALARPTLRVTDERGLHPEFVLLPAEARSCSLRVDPRRAAYRVEYGFTLPSGEFRRLAESAVQRPPSAPPRERIASATARVSTTRAPLSVAESRRRIEQAIRAGDWARAHSLAADAGVEVVAVLDRRPAAAGGSSEAAMTMRGGASDLHR